MSKRKKKRQINEKRRLDSLQTRRGKQIRLTKSMTSCMKKRSAYNLYSFTTASNKLKLSLYIYMICKMSHLPTALNSLQKPLVNQSLNFFLTTQDHLEWYQSWKCQHLGNLWVWSIWLPGSPSHPATCLIPAHIPLNIVFPFITYLHQSDLGPASIFLLIPRRKSSGIGERRAAVRWHMHGAVDVVF